MLSKQDLINAINSMADWPKDYDGYGNNPPTEESRLLAIEFINGIPDDCALPTSAGCDGEHANIWWDTRGFYIDISIMENLTCSYYARDEHQQEYYGDDVSLESGIPQELLNIIKNR